MTSRRWRGEHSVGMEEEKDMAMDLKAESQNHRIRSRISSRSRRISSRRSGRRSIAVSKQEWPALEEFRSITGKTLHFTPERTRSWKQKILTKAMMDDG